MFTTNRPRTSRAVRRGLTVAAATAAFAFALSGCASAAGSSAGSADSTAAAACTTVDKVTVMMSTTVLDVSYAPYGILADELGYYKDMCLDVDFTINGSTISVEQALLSGQADYGMLSPDALIVAAETQANPIKITTNLMPKLIYNAAVKDGSSITDYSGLKGKIVGVPLQSALFNSYLQARLKESGLTLDDVQIIATGFGSAPMESLDSGAIDAFIAWPGLWASYRNADYKFTLLPEATWQGDYYAIGMGATDDYIAANPEVIEKLNKGIVMSTKYLQNPDNVENAVRLYWEEYPTAAPLPGSDEAKALKDDEAVLQATMDSMLINDRPADYSTWGAQDEATWTRQIQFDTEAGLVTKPLTASDFFTDEFTAQANG